MPVDFYSTVGGQQFISKMERAVPDMAKSLSKIAEELAIQNQLKREELDLARLALGLKQQTDEATPDF